MILQDSNTIVGTSTHSGLCIVGEWYYIISSFLGVNHFYVKIVSDSLDKTCMLYRIVYTKLSDSLLSQCGMSWIYFTRLSAASQVNLSAEYLCVYTLVVHPILIASNTNTYVAGLQQCAAVF